MKKIIFITLLLFPSYVFSQIDCSNLPHSFASYTNAINQIKKAKFSIKEKLNKSKSSWVTYADFYSCDGKTGFLIIGLKNKNYVHKDLPIQVWRKFKLASSFGSFYNQNIKNRYRFKLN